MRDIRLQGLCVAVALGVGSSAWAQEAPKEDDLVFKDGAFLIEGKVQKPEVVVVIKRDNLDKGFDLQLDEDFLRKIVDALEEEPF